MGKKGAAGALFFGVVGMHASDFDPDVLRKVIDALGLEKREGSVSYIFTCPRCSKARKLYIRKRDGRFICFRCGPETGFQGRPEYALAELSGRSVAEIQNMLYGEERLEEGSYIQLTIRDFLGIDEEVEEIEPDHPGLEWPPWHYTPSDPQFAAGLKYLESRGISRELAEEYGIRYNPVERRVVFPMFVNGVLRGWQSRYIGNTQIEYEDGTVKEIPKAITYRPKSSESFVMFQDRLSGSKHCVLTEGPVDAIKMHLCGGNVAALGKGVTPAQLATIAQYGIRKLYIGFDPDAANDIMRVAKEMWEYELYRIHVPSGRQDLGDCTLEEGFQAFQEAERITPTTLFIYTKAPAWMRL